MSLGLTVGKFTKNIINKYTVINDISMSNEIKLGRNVLESNIHCNKDLMVSTFYYSESCSYIRISNGKLCIY